VRVNKPASELNRLGQLTEKERAVLDLVLEHKPTKEIARELGLAPNTVDMRLRSAREKLGTTDRNATARAYNSLLNACGKTTCGSMVMEEAAQDALPDPWEHRDETTLVFQDAATWIDRQAPWDTKVEPHRSLEAFSDDLGAWARIAMVFGLAALLAITVLATFAIAESLSQVELPGFLTT
jgi:DNA-binding CsgD family transcriptional regulator